MNLQQARILLEKINSLFKSISADNGEISSIEKDLMMSYIRQFYETFVNADGSSASTAPANLEQRPSPPPPPQPQKRTYTPPKIIEIPDSLKELDKTPVAPPPPPKPQPKQEPVPEPKPPRASTTPPPTGKISTLFSFKEATELSEKLSQRPVNDLTKALTINDRLLYQNDLFGKSQTAMNDSLTLLNKFNSFEEAKSLLVNLASQHNWVDEEKLDSARNFIQLVRRRYQ